MHRARDHKKREGERERENFTRHTWWMLLIQIALLCPECITVQRMQMRVKWGGHREKKEAFGKDTMSKLS